MFFLNLDDKHCLRELFSDYLTGKHIFRSLKKKQRIKKGFKDTDIIFRKRKKWVEKKNLWEKPLRDAAMNASAGSQGMLSVSHLAPALRAEHWKPEPVPFWSSSFPGMEPRTLPGNSLLWIGWPSELFFPSLLSTSEASGRKRKDRKNCSNE